MSRQGVSYEQVAAIADGMVADGEKPTFRTVRSKLGKGSPNTIQRHLAKWQELRPQTAVHHEVSQMLINSFRSEIDVAVARSSSTLLEEIGNLKEALADISKSAEQMEIDLEAEREQRCFVTKERDELGGQKILLENEVRSLKDELGRERAAAERGRIEMAKRELRDEASVSLLEELDKTKKSLEAERATASEAREKAARLEGQLMELRGLIPLAENSPTNRQKK
jgi:chromosome segregation ATPase